MHRLQNTLNHKYNINKIINMFNGVGLKELDQVSLLNRVDTKFIFDIEKLAVVLLELQKHYSILDINGTRLNQYDSIYFDSPDLKLYHLHHNDRKNRFKIRYRKYVDSDLSFFELKMKNNKGRTNKKRIKTDDIYKYLTSEAKALFDKNISDREKWNFQFCIQILFNRLTLVDKKFSERATIDLNLTYQKDTNKVVKDRLVIVELKQSKQNRKSPMFEILKNNGVYPYKISKYCLGILSCYPNVKYNRFKKKLIKINSLADD